MSGDSVDEEILAHLAEVRVLVSYLGEKEQYAWWDTSFLSAVGLKYLKLNFPRSYFLAGVTAISQAAKKLHDDRIGKGAAHHLFRLPFHIEERLHAHERVCGLRAGQALPGCFSARPEDLSLPQ